MQGLRHKCLAKKRSLCMCNGIPLCSTSACVDKDHTPQVWPRELGQRPFDLGGFCIKITSLHQPKGAESANWEAALLGAGMDTLDLCVASSRCLWQRHKLQEKSVNDAPVDAGGIESPAATHILDVLFIYLFIFLHVQASMRSMPVRGFLAIAAVDQTGNCRLIVECDTWSA